jgi:hypothetical protein
MILVWHGVGLLRLLALQFRWGGSCAVFTSSLSPTSREEQGFVVAKCSDVDSGIVRLLKVEVAGPGV